MRNKLLSLLMLCAACGDDAGSTNYDAGNGNRIDAPEFAPSLTSFQVTPNMVAAGTPTMVTWNWTYAVEPTYPDPTCTIDNDVGAVMKGQMTTVMINSVTTFTITCTNSAGTTMRQVVLGVPPTAPALATFTATPAGTMTANQAGNVTFAWTFSNLPVPAPICTVDGGIGPVTTGQSVSVTLPQARTYRLRCTNGAGTSFLDATRIPVNECGVTSVCGLNAQCNETPEGYTCSCMSGFSGDGNTCNTVTDCGTTPTNCSANASCVSGGTQCQCNIGYVGDGVTCNKQLVAFVTSTTYSGSSIGGLSGADAACAARATAANLTGTFRAWMSDATNDAYCRVQNKSGKKANNCNEGGSSPPIAGGPWVRYEGAGVARRAFAPTIDKLTAATNRQLYYPASFSDAGSEAATGQRVWTGTDESGVYVPLGTCGDWSSTSGQGVAGFVHGGSSTWTRAFTNLSSDAFCSSFYPLRCMEIGTGAALAPRHPVQSFKRAFVTSVTGTGQLSSWADANNQSGILAADQICQARARYAGYNNPLNFKAWASTSSGYVGSGSRIFNTSLPYIRPDGVVIGGQGTGRTGLLGTGVRLTAAWNQTETNSYVTGNWDAGYVWVGHSSSSGFYTTNCSSFTQGTNFYSGYYGKTDMLDQTYMYYSSATATCDQMFRLYCVED